VVAELLTAYILTFATTSAVLAADKRTSAEGIAADLIPVPVAITSDCGFCLRIPAGALGLSNEQDGEELVQMEGLAGPLGAQGLWTERTAVAVESGQKTGLKRTYKEQKHYEQIF